MRLESVLRRRGGQSLAHPAPIKFGRYSKPLGSKSVEVEQTRCLKRREADAATRFFRVANEKLLDHIAKLLWRLDLRQGNLASVSSPLSPLLPGVGIMLAGNFAHCSLSLTYGVNTVNLRQQAPGSSDLLTSALAGHLWFRERPLPLACPSRY